MNNQAESSKQVKLDQSKLEQSQVEIKLNEYGAIDVDYYRAQAESLRADFIKSQFKSLVSLFKKSTASIDLGNLATPKAHIVSSQKLTLSI